MRVLLDANILISYLLTPTRGGPITQIVTRGLLGEFVLLLPDALIEELKRKASEKKYRADRITPGELGRFLDVLVSCSEMIAAIEEAIPAVTRDRKDDYLLACALVGQADYLVTGDEDLLVLQQAGRLAIVSPQEFWRMVQGEVV